MTQIDYSRFVIYGMTKCFEYYASTFFLVSREKS